MLKVGLFLMVLGALFAFVGINEARQSAAGKEEPQDITCEKLIDEGFGDNAHVRLLGFHLCTEAYVYETDIDESEAWVPVVPKGGEVHKALTALAEKDPDSPFPLGEKLKLIVNLPNMKNEYDITIAANASYIQGLVIEPFNLPGYTGKWRLADRYPGLDLDNCLLLVEGRRPSSTAKTNTIVGVGGAAAIIGAILVGIHLRRR